MHVGRLLMTTLAPTQSANRPFLSFFLAFGTLIVFVVTLLVTLVLASKSVRVETRTVSEPVRPSSYAQAVEAWGEPEQLNPDEVAPGAQRCGLWALGQSVQVVACE